MDNPEKQKTERVIKNGQSRETEKTEGVIKNGQSRETEKTEGIIKNGQSRETEKTEGIIKNGQSRETGNIGHKTQNRDKENKTKKMNNTDPIKNRLWTEVVVKGKQFMINDS